MAGGSYGLAPMQGYVKESADRLRQFTEQFGGVLAIFGSASTPDGARTALGLGSASTRNAGSYPGQVMLIGHRDSPMAASLNTWGNSFQMWESAATAGAPEASSFGTIINANWGPSGAYGTQIILSVTGRIWFRAGDYATASVREIYHTGNTTRGSGGALSAASPIVRIADAANSERRDLFEQSFVRAGAWGAANDEAPGVSVERIDVGVYRITGSLGLAVEGWRIQDPCSPDGGRTLGITESEQDEHGVVTVRLFKQRWTLDEDGEMHLGKGVHIDVPVNSWIDVRLQMPAVEVVPPPTA